jgi:hypothetical protein
MGQISGLGPTVSRGNYVWRTNFEPLIVSECQGVTWPCMKIRRSSSKIKPQLTWYLTTEGERFTLGVLEP